MAHRRRKRGQALPHDGSAPQRLRPAEAAIDATPIWASMRRACVPSCDGAQSHRAYTQSSARMPTTIPAMRCGQPGETVLQPRKRAAHDSNGSSLSRSRSRSATGSSRSGSLTCPPCGGGVEAAAAAADGPNAAVELVEVEGDTGVLDASSCFLCGGGSAVSSVA